jgi:endo-1,4-beta-xylanase
MPSFLDIIANSSIRLGTATGTVNDPTYNKIRHDNFNMYVGENNCKFDQTEVVRGTIAFRGDAAQMIKDAQSSGKLIKGHNFAWHMQVPYWYNKLSIADKKLAIEHHVRGLAKLTVGTCYKWDVVNEFFDNDANFSPRPFWKEIGGEAMVANCFRWAHEENPKAILVYNDYGNTKDCPKSDAIRAMVKRLKTSGVPIHEVGIQCHERVDYMDDAYFKSIVVNMKKFKDIGVRVNFSEVDLRIDYKLDSFTLAQRFQKAGEVYYKLYKTALSYPDICNEITLWQFTGKKTWIYDYCKCDHQYCPVPWGNNLEELPAVNRIKDALREVVGLHKPIPVPRPPTPAPTPKPPTPKPPTPAPVPTPKPPTPAPVPAPKPPLPPPKPPTPTPTPVGNISLTTKITNTWQDSGKTLIQYDIIAKNTSSNTIKNTTIKITSAKIRQLWNLEGNIAQSNFTLPSWLSAGLLPNGQFTFGFISEGNATITVV